MIKQITLRTLLGAGLLCGAGLTARADDTVTFQVDMSRYTNSAGSQMATNVEVRGDGIGPGTWGGGNTLVNNGANVYTNTFTCVGAASSTHEYKYTFQYWSPGVNWEDNNPPNDPGQPPDANNNRVLALGAVPGSQVLPVTPFYAPSITVPLADPPLAPVNPVFFQVDMSRFTNGSGVPAFSVVSLQGNFQNWSAGYNLVAAGGGIYTNTFDLATQAPGYETSWKYTFTADNGLNWEDSIGGTNRSFVVAGGPAVQVLPLVEFYAPSIGTPLEYVTNMITFQVDMQVQGVAFINGGGSVKVSGSFNGWPGGGGDVLTNDPAAPLPASYIYSGTFRAVYQKYFPNFPAASEYEPHRYKFRANGGWEEPAFFNPLYNSNDRSFSGTNAGPTLVLPLVRYSDASLCDTLAQDTTVTFVLHLTNGTVATDGHAFVKGTDTVYMNGESLLGVWQTWSSLFCPPLINDPPDSDYYTYTQLIPAGRPVNQKVKYSIGGTDNEAPQFSDHIQWIRTTNTTYVMSPVEFGTNYASVRVQPQYGDLKAGVPSGGNVPITWLGCPCVTLQSRSSLSSGSWTDLPATESASSTNVPNVGAQYFRLQKRPNP